MGVRARVALAFIAVSVSFCLTGCGSIDDLKDVVYGTFDIGRVPDGRGGLLPVGLPDATPMIPPEKKLKENASYDLKKKDKIARKPRQPHTVELPKKPPISDFNRSGKAARRRGANRAVSACAVAIAHSLARSAGTWNFFTLRLPDAEETSRTSCARQDLYENSSGLDPKSRAHPEGSDTPPPNWPLRALLIVHC